MNLIVWLSFYLKFIFICEVLIVLIFLVGIVFKNVDLRNFVWI